MAISRHAPRVAAFVVTCATLFGVALVEPAMADTPVGNGSCGAGNYCEYKNGDRGLPVADWSGDSNVNNYHDWEYYNTSDEVNDEVSWIWNRDSNRQFLYEDLNRTGPASCFPAGWNSTNTKGRENNGSSLLTGSLAGC